MTNNKSSVQPTIKIAIYQLPFPSDSKFTFLNFNFFQKHNVELRESNYEKIYSFEINRETYYKKIRSDLLEYIFQIFNVEHPSDYTGRSLSVSDVIVVENDGIKDAYFVDSIGFKKVDGFFEQN